MICWDFHLVLIDFILYLVLTLISTSNTLKTKTQNLTVFGKTFWKLEIIYTELYISSSVPLWQMQMISY